MSESERERHFGNISIKPTLNVVHRFHYGIHEGFRHRSEELAEGTDAVFLETGALNYPSNPLGCLDIMRRGDQPYIKNYRDLFPKIEERGVPIFFFDFCPRDCSTLDKEEVLWWIEFFSGSFLAGGAIAQEILNSVRGEKRRISRRDFLKGGLAVAGSWLAAPALIDVATAISVIEGRGNELTREVGRRILKSHPEWWYLSTLGVRNVVMAEKLAWLSDFLSEEKGRRVNIDIFVGGSHFSLEEWVGKSSETRISFLRRIGIERLRRVFYLETLYTALELRFSNGHWEIGEEHQIPSLVDLANLTTR